jgi:hypothetical protein
MPQFAEVVLPAEPAFVSPTQEPQKIEPPPDEAAEGANQIIAPGEAAPAQPSN